MQNTRWRGALTLSRDAVGVFYNPIRLGKIKRKAYVFVIGCIYLPLPARARYDTIFKRSLTGLNSEFSFSGTGCHTKIKELSLPNYLPTAGGRMIGCIPFPRILALYKMQTVSSTIWTWIAESILSDDDYYTASTPAIGYVWLWGN